MARLLDARAFSVATIEIDLQVAPGDEHTIDRYNDFFWSHGYGMFLKYNCGSSGSDISRTAFYPIHGRYRRSIQHLEQFWSAVAPTKSTKSARLVQDVIVFDMKLSGLQRVLRAANAACRTDFPVDTRCGPGNVLPTSIATGAFLPFVV
mgnify:CR=1 FL=1|jgi:hypothetical protein